MGPSISCDTVESFEGRKTDDQSHAEVGDEVVKPTPVQISRENASKIKRWGPRKEKRWETQS